MKFSKDTKIGEILEKDPDKVDILIQAGMHCIGCPASQGETLEEACMIHGIDVNDVVEEYLDLLAQYKQGQIRHNELVDWINKELVNANDRIR